MATIRKRTGENGKTTYNAQHRPKGLPHRQATFADEETALMWASYQELIDNERRDFKARDGDVYTLRDVVEAKYKEDQRTKRECLLHFREIEDLPLSQCTFQRLQEHCTHLLNTPVQRGGCSKTGSGPMKLPEKMTVLRKFAYVQSAVNYMIGLGCDLENNFEKIVARLRSEMKGNV